MLRRVILSAVKRLSVLILIVTMAVWGQPGWSHQDDPKLDDLFARLQQTIDFNEARELEHWIWSIWLDSGDETVDKLMDRGSRAMESGNFPSALTAFNAVVEMAPDFAEGWNKRATLYWLMGDYDRSVSDIDETLALEPRHFGALSGLAMIREAQERPEDALDALRRAAAVHPLLPHIEKRIQHLERNMGEPI